MKEHKTKSKNAACQPDRRQRRLTALPCAQASRQQGVTSLFFVLLLAAGLLFFFALAIDSARLYDAHRALQNQANAAAIAAANATQACGSLDQNGNAISVSDESITARAQAAAIAAGFSGGTVLATSGMLKSEAKLLVFHPRAPVSSNAVHVELKKDVPLSMFLPGWFDNNIVHMSAQATAKKELVATLSASGSTLSTSSNKEAVLNALLGAVIPNYQGIGTLNPAELSKTLISVGSLLNDSLGVNNLTDLLGLDAAGLSNVLNGVNGVAGPLATNILDPLLGQLADTDFKVSDVLDITATTEAAKNSKFSAYDLVSAIVLNLVQQKLNPLELKTLKAENLGLGNVINLDDVKLYVGSPPKIAVGPALKGGDGKWMTRVEAADVTLALNADIDLSGLGTGSNDASTVLGEGLSNLLTPLLGAVSGLANVEVHVPLVVQTGAAKATFEAASCRHGLSNATRVKIGASASTLKINSGYLNEDYGNNMSIDAKPISVKVTLLSGLLGSLKDSLKGLFTGNIDDFFNNLGNVFANLGCALDILNLSGCKDKDNSRTADVELNINLNDVTLDSSAEDQSYSDVVDLHKIYDGSYKPVSLELGGGLNGLDLGGSTAELKVLGEKGGGVPMGGLNDLLDPLISGLGQGVINPILEGLGLQLGMAKVTIVSVTQSPARLVPGHITIVNN